MRLRMAVHMRKQAQRRTSRRRPWRAAARSATVLTAAAARLVRLVVDHKPSAVYRSRVKAPESGQETREYSAGGRIGLVSSSCGGGGSPSDVVKELVHHPTPSGVSNSVPTSDAGGRGHRPWV